MTNWYKTFNITISNYCNIINSLNYLRPTTKDCRLIGIRKLEFVAKTKFLSKNLI